MNNKDRILLTELKVNTEYIKRKVDSLDERVAIQNGRVTVNEKAIQHLNDTINGDINNAIKANDSDRLKKYSIVIGIIVGIASLLAQLIFSLIK